jgi:hypothetical protein
VCSSDLFIAALDQVATASTGNTTVDSAAAEVAVEALPAEAEPAEVVSTAKTTAQLDPGSGMVVQSDPSDDSRVINSAAQHVFLPPRSFNLKLVLRVVAVVLAGVLVAGAGYLKYRSVRRVRIEGAISEKLKAAPPGTLSGADLRVFVSDDCVVTLDGKVRGQEDSALAESMAASVAGVIHVNNHLIVTPPAPAESWESLIKRGIAFLDSGDYPSAVDCFSKALADPNSKGAKELLDLAQRAQKTEEELLKNRQ